MKVFEGGDLNFGVVVSGCCTMEMAPLIEHFRRKNEMTGFSQFPYSHDLAPADFLFPKLSPYKGRRFDIIEEIKLKSLEKLQDSGNTFSTCFQQWTRRWEKCVTNQGEYSVKKIRLNDCNIF